MSKLDKQYTDLLQDILDNGVKKETRNGGTISVFGRQIRHKMSDGFPLLTTKKMYMKGIITELLWFLRGDTNVKYLVDNDCHIWDGDAYKSFEKWQQETDAKIRRENPTIDFQPLEYESKEEFINKIKTDDEFAKKWGELGPIYGAQWRSWGRKNVVNYDLENVKWSYKDKVMELIKNGGDYSKYDVKVTYQNNSIDQIQNLINDIKTNPDSRRLMVNAWNVGELDSMTLPPCHYGFQVYTRELSREERWDLYSNRYTQMKPYKFQKMLDGIWVESTEEEDMFEYDVFRIPKRAISLMWNQRSVDTFLGLPFNIASYGLLLEIIAKMVNMVPDELIGNLGDTHLYLNHIEQAKEQIGREMTNEERNEWCLINQCGGNIRDCKTDWKDFELDQQNVPKRTREPFPLPTLRISSEPLDDIAHHEIMDFDILNYQSHPSIKAPLSN
jgi:thymidylate synthase